LVEIPSIIPSMEDGQRANPLLPWIADRQTDTNRSEIDSNQPPSRWNLQDWVF
jgi:hypothetical protein